MRTIGMIHVASCIISMITATQFIANVTPVNELVEWCPPWLMVPYAALLAILKYRAAHHRKIRKWQRLGSSGDSVSKLWMYLGEIFHCEAKMSIITSPLLGELWTSFCCVIVWILFPKRIALAYMMIVIFFPYAHTVMGIGTQRSFDKANSCFYNGKRYKCIQVSHYCSALQDEEKNRLYYPAIDVLGLLPPDA